MAMPPADSMERESDSGKGELASLGHQLARKKVQVVVRDTGLSEAETWALLADKGKMTLAGTKAAQPFSKRTSMNCYYGARLEQQQWSMSRFRSSWSLTWRHALLIQQRHRCAMCRSWVLELASVAKWRKVVAVTKICVQWQTPAGDLSFACLPTLDHIVPKSVIRRLPPEVRLTANAQVLCSACHEIKTNRFDNLQFAAERSRSWRRCFACGEVLGVSRQCRACRFYCWYPAVADWLALIGNHEIRQCRHGRQRDHDKRA